MGRILRDRPEKEAYSEERKDEQAGRVHVGKIKLSCLAAGCSVGHSDEETGKCKLQTLRAM